jgi:hypothetical protein
MPVPPVQKHRNFKPLDWRHRHLKAFQQVALSIASCRLALPAASL